MLDRLFRRSVNLVPWSLRNTIRDIPILAKLQRAILAATLNGKEFAHFIKDGPARGLTYPVLFPDDKNIWTGTYELGFVEALAASVRPGDVCFDIGGFRGYCAGVMACRGASRVVVFEPLPANIARIAKLMDLNPSLEIDVRQTAVGDREGEVQFEVMDADSMGKMADSPFQADQVGKETIAVPITTLDALVSSGKLQFPQVIKIDVEGAELAALLGARQLIERCRPKLFVETHSRELTRDVTGFLTARGYRLIAVETQLPPDGATEPEVCHLAAICDA